MSAAAYFSASYGEARAKILSEAAAHGARHAAHHNPYARGPDGGDLFLDVLTLGPEEATQALVISSATHGVEGFAGSGVQVGMLREGLAAARGAGTRIVLIHAINPYGFAWLRRVNEDNVDLNRNCIDHAQALPENADYAELADVIAPREWTEASRAAVRAALRTYVERHGAFRLQEAVSKGQYRFPGGLYFGGTRETWSIGTLRHVVRRELAAVQRVIFLDVHTGLGAPGALEIISEYPPEDPRYRRARDWWGDCVKTTATGESLSAHLTGTLDELVPALLPRAEVTLAALEYGTQPIAVVMQALQADNWLHTYGNPAGPDAAAIKDEIRRAFYTDTTDWKSAVWSTAADVIRKSLTVLAA